MIDSESHLLPINTQAANLRVEIGHVTPMKHRIVTETNAWYDMTRTEGNLFNLREIFVHVAIQNKLAYRLKWDELFGPDLRVIQNVEIKFMLVFFLDNLDRKCPLGKSAILDRLF